MSSAFNIPAGFALVPLEPTMEMLRAGFENREGPTPYEAYRPSEVAAIFRDMLSAAPTPPVDAVPGEPVAWQCRKKGGSWGPPTTSASAVQQLTAEGYETRQLGVIAPAAAAEPSEHLSSAGEAQS